MRFGIRTAVALLILGALAITAFGIDRTWRRFAERNTRTLLGTLVGQITGQVRKEFWAEVVGVEERYGILRERLASGTDLSGAPEQRALRLSALLAGRNSFGWIAHVGADGSLAAVRNLDAGHTMALAGMPDSAGARLNVSRWMTGSADPQPAVSGESIADIRRETWFGVAITTTAPGWQPISDSASFDGAVAVYAAALVPGNPAAGVLAAFARPADLARLLGRVEVGDTGAVFLIAPDGGLAIAPDVSVRTGGPMDMTRVKAAAFEAGQRIRQRPDTAKNIVESVQLSAGRERFAVALSPLEFRDWQLAVIIPEREFLAEIEAVTRRVAWLVLGLVALAGLGALWLARRFIVTPVRDTVTDLRNIETLRLDRVLLRSSRLTEFSALSEALQRVSTGLSAFAKYIPIDLVRTLLAEGVEARPGGEQRQITVLFADIEGFTGMSERLGPGIVPIVSAYFEAMTGAIAAHGGTVDKFIGDAVMAFWGAPKADPEQAANACRAALACLAALRAADIRDDRGVPLRVRIGINSGMALVGNIGSKDRLNYTAIGDCVNVASRLEGANKFYGTAILVGESTRQAAGSAVPFREIDCAAVYGRAGGMRLFEPLPEGGAAGPGEAYAAALAEYRAGRFAAAAAEFRRALTLAPGDAPAMRLRDLAEDYAANPPKDWSGVTTMDQK